MNMLYITPEVVQASLTRSWKTKEFNIDDVTEWCAQCELELIEDITTMIQFEEVGVTIEHSRAKLPCNIFKIEDVYDC